MKNLTTKKGLIIGVANDASIAYGCARVLREQGCTSIIVTYQNQKAYKYVKEACNKIGVTNLIEFEYSDENSIIELFNYVKEQYGEIDFVIHSMAFANLQCLHGRVVDCLLDDFYQSINISGFVAKIKSCVTIC